MLCCDAECHQDDAWAASCSDAKLESLVLLGGFQNNRSVFDW